MECTEPASCAKWKGQQEQLTLQIQSEMISLREKLASFEKDIARMMLRTMGAAIVLLLSALGYLLRGIV